MILDSTLRSLEFKLSGAITTNQLPFIASYADHDFTNKTYTPGANTGQSNNTTAVTVVAAPASGDQRQIKSINIYNADTVSATVIVQYNDNGTLRQLFAIALATGESLQYSYEDGWSALTASGKRKVEVGTGGGGGLSDGDYGDITVSGSGTVMNIDAGVVGTTEIAGDSVTHAKYQNIGTDRLLGRDTAASGDPEELTVTGGLEFTGAGGIQRSALTGDVTAAAGSNATTIANDAVTTLKILNANVTLAKIQNIGTDRLLGRDTAASGVVEELTVGGGIEFTGAGGIQRSAFSGGDVTAAAGSAALTIANDAVTDAKLRNSAALSVIGRSVNSTGDPADIAASADNQVLQRIAGALLFSALDTIPEDLSLIGIISPASIGANQNDYNPAGLSTATIVRLTSSNSFSITGLQGGTAGRVILLVNIGSFNLSLANESASSTAANRFTFSVSSATDIQPNESIALIYDGTTSRWRMMTNAITTGSLSLSRLSQSPGVSVLGKATAGSGDRADITASADGDILRRSAGSLGFGAIPESSVTNLTTDLAAKQANIQFQDEGSNAGTAGGVTTLNFTGAGVSASFSSGTLTVTISGGGGGGSPGGSTGDVQYNDGAGGFAAEAAFTYDAATNQLTVPGLAVTEDLALSGDISPAQITAIVNDYAPTGNATATVWRIDSDADFRGITGIAGGTAGRILVLINIGSFVILLMNESVSSTAANRIVYSYQNTVNFLLNPLEAVILVYDDVSSRWRLIERSVRILDRDLQLPLPVSPAALGSSQNDYAPTGITANSILRLSASTPINITGLNANQATLGVSTLLFIYNTGANAITLKDEDAASSANNRLALASDVVLNQDEGCLLLYDATSFRWRAIARPVAAGGGSGDSISVNGVAATDADFDNTTPAAPASAINVEWQKDSGTPNNISANVPYASPLGVSGGDLTLMLDTLRFRGTNAFLAVTPGSDQNNYAPSNLEFCTFLNIAPTASIKITGLVPTNTDRMIVISNTSTDYLLILERESTLSTAANRFSWPACVAWLFLMPGDSYTFIYNSTSSRWQLLGSSSLNNQFNNFSDCHGASCYGTSVSGTGASFQAGTYLANSTEKPKGIIQVDTGTTSTGRAYYGDNVANNTVPGQGAAIYLTRLAPETLSDGTNRYQVIAGFHDAIGGTNVTDGVYWKYDDASASVWRRCAAAASTRTETSATPTVDTNYIWLGIFINPAWSRADYFYSTDSLVMNFDGSVSTNMPSSSQIVNVAAGINKTVGTTQRNLSVDLQADRYDFLRG